MDDIQEILTELGYKLKNCGDYYQTSGLHRGGDNPTALSIYHRQGLVVDFVTGERFSVRTLIQKTLGLPGPKETEEWLKNKKYTIPDITISEQPKLKMAKILDPECLSRLLPIYTYWQARCISEETLKEFGGGLCQTVGKFNDYFTFPIWNSTNDLVGLSGRYTGSLSNKPKWKHFNSVCNWSWPLKNSLKYIQNTGNLVIVESIGDGLSLFQAGIKSIFCIFGIEIHVPQVNTLLRVNPKKIIISLNNDENKNNVGNLAAEKLQKKLNKYFDYHQISIKLPVGHKDWNEVLMKEGAEGIRKQWND